MLRSSVAVRLCGLAALAALAGCPQERPGAERQIPTQRVPPAMSIEPGAADAGAPGADAAGAQPRP